LGALGGGLGGALGSFRGGRFPKLAELVLHRSDHFLRGVEGAECSTFLEIVLGLSQTGIHDPALLGGVFVIGSRELRGVGYELGSQYNLATMYRSFYQVAFGYTDSGAETARERHLALAVDSDERGHNQYQFEWSRSRLLDF
jgi:hypothetical protein